MQQTKKLMLVGMVSGLTLPEALNELQVGKARIFRNAAAIRNPGAPPELGANIAIYSGEGQERHLTGEVAAYLIECVIDTVEGKLGHTRIGGSGGVTIGMMADSDGVTISTGKRPYSAVSISAPLGKAWDTPSLMQGEFNRAILPLRLLTKGRILVFPVSVLAYESRQTILDTGVTRSCPEPLGTGLQVALSSDDCQIIEDFSKLLAKKSLNDFEVPIFLFSRSFYKTDIVDRALDLITTLECLLSGGPESIAYKIAFRASCLTSKDEEERWRTFRFTKEIYKYRNSLVHGNKKTLAKARSALAQQMEQVEELTRNCLKLACLLEVTRPKLPSGQIIDMRKEESIDEYLLTHCLNKPRPTPLDDFPTVGKLRIFTRVL